LRRLEIKQNKRESNFGIKFWFLVRGKTGVPGGKPELPEKTEVAGGKLEYQQTRLTRGIEAKIKPRPYW